MRRGWVSLVRLGVVILLLGGFAVGIAQLLPAVPAAQATASAQDDDDLGTVVQQMATTRQQASDRYARFNAALQRRVDQVTSAWHSVASTLGRMTLAEQIATALTLPVSLFGLANAPKGARILRRRLPTLS
jgi:hypothetical protein